MLYVPNITCILCSSVPPLCSSVPYSVGGLTPEAVGDIKPEQRLKSLLSALISGDEDKEISLADISSRIAQALKVNTKMLKFNFMV